MGRPHPTRKHKRAASNRKRSGGTTPGNRRATAAHANTKGNPRSNAQPGSKAQVRTTPPSRARATAEDNLHPRDRGPVRAYVRDVVDSRHHLVGLFIPAFGGLVIATLSPASELQHYLQLGCLVAVVVLGVMAIVLGARITRMARARFPDEPVNALQTGWYAFVRVHKTRRLRVPAPRVVPGALP